MQRVHRLVVFDEKGNREFVLDGSIHSLGRDPDCDIPLPSGFVSRYHATLVRVTNENDSCTYRLIDGNYKFIDGELVGQPSKNGLIVNGRRVQTHTLRHGDEIDLGRVQMVYYAEPDRPPRGNPPWNPNDYSPRKPYPDAPDFGAEALPDEGISRIP